MRKLIFCKIVVLALAGALGAAPALAKTISTASDMQADDPFAKFLVSKGHLQALTLLAQRYDAQLGEPCNETSTVKPVRLELVAPITMTAEDTHPTAGNWYERYTVARCAVITTYNALFEIAEDGTLAGRILVPGRTGQRAWLVKDLIPAIVQAAKMESCDAVLVADTRRGVTPGVTVEVPGGDYEVWTMRGCGEDVVLVLRFESATSGDRIIKIEQEVSRGPSRQRW